MKITFYGAARTVTGSCYLLEYQGKKFLVDCGLFQGNKELKERNYGEFPFNPGEIDFVILTHAHVDHTGLLPKLFLKGFKGPVYGTNGTVDLAGVLLPDCGHIQEMEVERKNRKKMRSGSPLLEPIYKAEDAYACLQYLHGLEYDEPFEPIPGLQVILRDAGHILGSAMLEMDYQEDNQSHKLVFTGDLGRPKDFITKEPHVFEKADFVVMESTYGNRNHDVKEADTALLSRIIKETFQAGGNVIIPAFAIDRSQDLLMILETMMENGELGKESVYLDSPLAIAATEIFMRHADYFNEALTNRYHLSGGKPFNMPGLRFSRTAEESMALNQIQKGAIIISASGMADAGRIKHHLKHNLWRKESTVIFIGYQAEGTLGRRLLDGEKNVRIHGEDIEVNARIVNMDGFSAHADRDELLDWVSNFQEKPHLVFVTHGEEKSAVEFSALVEDKFGIRSLAPLTGDVFDLTHEIMLHAGIIPKTDISTIDPVVLQDINAYLDSLVAKGDRDKLVLLRDLLKNLQ